MSEPSLERGLMFQVLMCVREAHDLRLVAVAALICALASCAAFGFHKQSQQALAGLRSSWIVLAGLVAGSGVWATHFMAMLAYQPSLHMGYEPFGTAASLLAAILGMGLAFALSVIPPRRLNAVLGGAAAGLSIAVMHYLGTAAIRAPVTIGFNQGYVALSAAFGVAGAIAAFVGSRRLGGKRGWAFAATMFFLAVCSLHFTGMTAIELRPDASQPVSAQVIGRGVLAAATSALAALILAAALALIFMERLSQRSTLHGVRYALDAVPAALSFYDSNSRLVSWNQAAADILGAYGVSLKVGMARTDIFAAVARAGWFGAVRPDDDNAIMTEVRAWRNRGSEFQLPDGRWMRHDAFPTRDGGGVTVMTDITEQRAATEAMAQALDDAEAASRAKSAFLANMSHEIRTPLNGVLGIADLLLRTPLDTKQQELVGVIQSSGTLLNALLTDLLDLARVEAGVAGLRPEPTDLAELVRSVAALFAGRAEQKGLVLRTEINLGDDSWAMCDPLRLRQVIGNLINNAVKFTEAGAVTVVAERQGDAVAFRICDTGVGFDEALKATLFGRFQQADNTSTRRHGGAGLGLSICQEYLRLMGATLDCASRPGEGSVFAFSVELPRVAQAAPAKVRPATDLPRGFRVLIVDDNTTNRQILSLILEAAGIVHAEAEDGHLALDAVIETGFDAVLMDIQMPVMDGLECTRRIRAWEAETGRPRMPIYMVSANCLQEHVDAGMAAGADGHLSKPVSMVQLLTLLAPHAAALAA